jgi:transposase-like protein
LADVAIIVWVERRPKRTAQDKAAVLAEVQTEGGKVTVVARRHRISESVLSLRRSCLEALACRANHATTALDAAAVTPTETAASANPKRGG